MNREKIPVAKYVVQRPSLFSILLSHIILSEFLISSFSALILSPSQLHHYDSFIISLIHLHPEAASGLTSNWVLVRDSQTGTPLFTEYDGQQRWTNWHQAGVKYFPKARKGF